MRSIAATLVFTLSLLTAGSAQARPEFPQAVQDAADAPCLPQCSLCHRDTSGGGVADQPFAQSLLSQGDGNGEEGIVAAMDRMRQQNMDSDGDGTSDIDELSQGKDPNYAGDALVCLPDVGCGARVARAPAEQGMGAVLTALAALALAHLRRRRRAQALRR
ncbi:MAG: hypothetical protein R3B13_41235 [Polyangiaceae bacterium]